MKKRFIHPIIRQHYQEIARRARPKIAGTEKARERARKAVQARWRKYYEEREREKEAENPHENGETEVSGGMDHRGASILSLGSSTALPEMPDRPYQVQPRLPHDTSGGAIPAGNDSTSNTARDQEIRKTDTPKPSTSDQTTDSAGGTLRGPTTEEERERLINELFFGNLG